jgi:hypothetical protein
MRIQVYLPEVVLQSGRIAYYCEVLSEVRQAYRHKRCDLSF